MVQTAEQKNRIRYKSDLQKGKEPPTRKEANRKILEEVRAELAKDVIKGKEEISAEAVQGRKNIQDAEGEAVQQIKDVADAEREKIKACAEAAAAMRAASRARRAASRSGNSEASGTGSALARRDGVAHTKKSRPVHETMRASAESRTNWAALEPRRRCRGRIVFCTIDVPSFVSPGRQ